jgi:hypothetical protein
MSFSLFSPAVTVTVTVAATAVTVVADLVGYLFGHLLFHLEGDRIAVLVGDLLACLWERLQFLINRLYLKHYPCKI